MGIALFVIALVSNIFTILIMRYGFTGNYEYKQGMILGVHIPQENIGDEEVAGLIEKTKHKPLLPEFRISKFVAKHYIIIAIVFVVLFRQFSVITEQAYITIWIPHYRKACQVFRQIIY